MGECSYSWRLVLNSDLNIVFKCDINIVFKCDINAILEEEEQSNGF